MNKTTPLKILMQEKIMQTSGANSDHKHSEIERFSTLDEVVQSHSRENSKDSVIVTCQ